ncbi:MAG: glycosyl transferase [Actinomycetota bacterium]|nr:glycosyl transferase [Actinomycetota bacterium]
MTSILVRAVIAMAVSLLVAPPLLVLLRRGHVLDHPSARSSHATPTPRGGGVAPAAGALLALAVTPFLTGDVRWALVVAAGTFGLVGLLEDVVGIGALRRLGAQFAAAVCAGVFLLHGLTGPALWRGIFAIGVVFWLVAFVNAYNFMDGIDGISVAQAVGTGVTWFVVGRLAGSPVLAAGGAIAAGAALGFAPYNLPHARMFLGDVGSYSIGAWLAAVAVLALRAGVRPEAVLAPLALYLADTGTTLLRRVVRGQRWYLPHRDHAYQRLTDAGWSHVQVSGVVLAFIGTCGLLGAASLGDSVPARVAGDLAIIALIGAYLFSPRWIARLPGTRTDR